MALSVKDIWFATKATELHGRENSRRPYFVDWEDYWVLVPATETLPVSDIGQDTSAHFTGTP